MFWNHSNCVWDERSTGPLARLISIASRTELSPENFYLTKYGRNQPKRPTKVIVQADLPVLPIVFGEMPVAIARRAMAVGRREGYDVVLIDTAGRLTVDDAMMAEADRSCIASSSALCVFGVARLISSARMMLAKIGPRSMRKVEVATS